MNTPESILKADPPSLRKHGAVGIILACYVLGMVLLQLVLIRTGPKPGVGLC